VGIDVGIEHLEEILSEERIPSSDDSDIRFKRTCIQRR